MNRPRACLALILAICISTAPLMPAAAVRACQAPSPEQTAKKAVTVHINGGEGHTHKIDDVPWRQGMTVLQALQLLAKRKQHAIQHESTGRGNTAFVTEIDGLKNQGSGGLNWTYRVNGKAKPVSCGACRVQPGDTIEWTFARYD